MWIDLIIGYVILVFAYLVFNYCGHMGQENDDRAQIEFLEKYIRDKKSK